MSSIKRTFRVDAYRLDAATGQTVVDGTRPFEVDLEDAILQMFYDNEATFFDDGVDEDEYRAWIAAVAPWAHDVAVAAWGEFGERYEESGRETYEQVVDEVVVRIRAAIAERTGVA